MASRAQKLAMGGLRLLPKALRHSLMRKAFRLRDEDLAKVSSVHIARTVDEYVASMGLVYDGYVKRGILLEHDAKVRMTPYLALPSTVIFVAIENGEVAGTLSLVRDGPMGLPMQKIYGAEIEGLRAQGRVIAEVGALCVAENMRHAGVPFLLYKAMYLAATKLLGIDDLVIAVHPKAADLYSAMLEFEQFGPVKEYPTLTSAADAVALRLELRGIWERFEKKFSHLGEVVANPFWLYGIRQEKQIELPEDIAHLDGLKELHRKAMMKLAALRPDIVLDLNTAEFGVFREEMGR